MCKIFILFLFFFLGVFSSSYSADYKKGLAAARSGDFATALKEWQPLAEQGNANAQYSLGMMHDRGDGVLQDGVAAEKWYRLAAKQGLVHAQYNLAWMYHRGNGVDQDYKEAIKWYRSAAIQG
jgi:hypothetical protein